MVYKLEKMSMHCTFVSFHFLLLWSFDFIKFTTLQGMIDMDPTRSGNPAPLDALMLLPTPHEECNQMGTVMLSG